MIVVVDTNVLLSGFWTTGVCEGLIDRLFANSAIRVVVSEHILAEFAQHSRGKFRSDPDDLAVALAFLRRNTSVVAPFSVRTLIPIDPDDLPVLGAIIAARADVLVTGDAELLRLKAYEGVPILSPRQLLERLGTP